MNSRNQISPFTDNWKLLRILKPCFFEMRVEHFLTLAIEHSRWDYKCLDTFFFKVQNFILYQFDSHHFFTCRSLRIVSFRERVMQPFWFDSKFRLFSNDFLRFFDYFLGNWFTIRVIFNLLIFILITLHVIVHFSVNFGFRFDFTIFINLLSVFLRIIFCILCQQFSLGCCSSTLLSFSWSNDLL